MNERSKRISRLKSDRQSRESYIKSKLGVLVPSQIRALRLKSSTPHQKDLAKVAGSHQSRVSKIERPGEANMTLEKLSWIASVHKVGLIVKFVPFSEMLRWENEFSQDEFSVTPIDQDVAFLNHGLHATLYATKYYTRVQSSGDKPISIKGKDALLSVTTSVADLRVSETFVLKEAING